MPEDLRDKKYSSKIKSIYPPKPESVKLNEFKKEYKTTTENDSKLNLKLKKDKMARPPFPPLQRKRQGPRRDNDSKMISISDGPEFKAKGGRAGYKSGGRGCKLAMKGKGRAYGKNS